VTRGEEGEREGGERPPSPGLVNGFVILFKASLGHAPEKSPADPGASRKQAGNLKDRKDSEKSSGFCKFVQILLSLARSWKARQEEPARIPPGSLQEA
jgi:hypothetical protein